MKVVSLVIFICLSLLLDAAHAAPEKS